jgi:DNA-binding GntR family transcriptional regulator
VEQGLPAVESGDVDAAVALNACFHAKITEPAGNALPPNSLRRWTGVRWCYTPAARQRGRQSWTEHQALLAAIPNRGEREAARLMREHTGHTRRSCHARDRA